MTTKTAEIEASLRWADYYEAAAQMCRDIAKLLAEGHEPPDEWELMPKLDEDET